MIHIVLVASAVGVCSSAYAAARAPPVVAGPLLRAARSRIPVAFESDTDLGIGARHAAGTAKLQILLKQQQACDHCVVPVNAEVPYDPEKKGVVIFLRHGESSWNAENRFTGWHDVPLSAEGEKQAVDAAATLRAAGLTNCIDEVYSSSLKRTIKTAWLLLEALDDFTIPIKQAWQLNERMYGMLTGLNKKRTREFLGDELFEELRREPPPLDRGSCYDPAGARGVWRTTPPEQVPLKESFEDTATRVLPYFKEDIEPRAKAGEAVLVVSSKNLLRSLIYGVTDWPLDQMVHIDIPNGQPIVYRPEDGTLHVIQPDGSYVYWGEAGGEGPLDVFGSDPNTAGFQQAVAEGHFPKLPLRSPEFDPYLS